MLSYVFFLFLNPLFAKGSKGPIELPDLGPVAKQDRIDLLYEKFAIHWQVQEALPPAKRSLWTPLFQTVGYWKFYLAIALYGVYQAFNFGPVLILNVLVEHFQGSSELSTGVLWTLVALMFVMPMLGSLASSHSVVLMGHIGLQFKNVLINKIYRKALLLSPSARQESSTGQIVNMFSGKRPLLLWLFGGECGLRVLTVSCASVLPIQPANSEAQGC